ncbi:MAG: DUF1738 domain-containing protein [Magnetospirillum sp.]|nr:MAG: DUF1738 domain-containing protein [Magnetospirillum sp.]
MADPKPNYRDEIAGEIISRIEAGTAPWQQPWHAGVIGVAPFNPVSGKPYRGINDLWLSLQDYADPRWMTYRQALEQGAQVRKGEKSTTIEYWKWAEQKGLTDSSGNPVLDADGKQRTETVRLERPRVFYAKVFNASQIDGLEKFVPPAPTFEPHERAETLIAGSGVPVLENRTDRAFYSPQRDLVHVPPTGAFKNQAAYYETVLHELGHATGHSSRLNRDFGPFGSESYAREELRAEIGSYMMARDLGISFDPSNHAAYVESWLKALRDDKNEIFRAAKDAETIKTWVMEPERRPELERTAQQQKVAQERTASETREPAMPDDPKTRIFLAVPFSEKDEAKAAGAKWDRAEKSWYIPSGTDPAQFAQWSAAEKSLAPAPALAPADEFAQALKDHGLVVEGRPVMDGQWHRAAVVGDRKGQLNGSYRGFLDGRPSGQITNYKSGEKAVKWVATGTALTDEHRARIQAEAATIRADRETAQRQAAEQAARKAYGVWQNLPGEATPDNCRYLAAKGVGGYGVKVDGDGRMIVPCRDAAGRLLTIQTMDEDGKRFIKGSQKVGTMHVVEATGKGTLETLTAPGPVIIAEGYATAATLFETTGRPAITAFDAGNLAAVAEAVRAKFPDREIVIAADNDHANPLGNIGVIKAEEAAKAIGATVVVPKFTTDEMAKGLTDFNDLATARGHRAVQVAIESVLTRNREPERSIA